MLARFNWRQKELQWKRPGAPQQEIKFADLGLSADRAYLVFEFWTQKFLGKSKGSFTAPAQDANNGLVELANRKETATVRIVPLTTKTVEWKMTSAHSTGA